MSKLQSALYIVITLLLATGCSQKNKPVAMPQGKVLMVSIEPQRQILEQLVDSSYSVASLLERGANPETFDPSTSERLAVDDATLYFATGVLPFEKKIAASTSTPIINTSVGVKLLFDTHGHMHQHHNHGDSAEGHSHDADPHYWSSIAGVRSIARNMAAALADAMPEEASTVVERLAAYEAHLDTLQSTLAATLQPHSGTAFAVWHPSLSYFARDFGLVQISLGLEGKDHSALGLRKAIDKAKESNVRVFFFQKEFDSSQAESINSSMGSRLVEINPLDYDWEAQLINIANEIARP